MNRANLSCSNTRCAHSLPCRNRQSIIPAQDLLRGPVHLNHSAVTIGDDHSRGELIEGPRGSGGFPTQLAKLGMHPGRIAERIEQLSKRCGCRRHYRCLIDSPMSAEDDRAGRAIEEPGPYNVANTGLDGIIIIPLIAPKDSLGRHLES